MFATDSTTGGQVADATQQRVAPPLEGPGFDAAWYALEREDRRRISRAVRRGEPLDDPVDAAFAVRVARKSQGSGRWWFYVFFAGLHAVQLPAAVARGDRAAALLHGILLLVAAVLALVFLRERRRARESERRNLQVLQEQPVESGTRGPALGPSPWAGGQ